MDGWMKIINSNRPENIIVVIFRVSTGTGKMGDPWKVREVFQLGTNQEIFQTRIENWAEPLFTDKHL